MKIYTKKGDAGYTTDILGGKYLKSDDFMELQGSIDEINAHVGLLRSKFSKIEQAAEKDYIDALLKDVQYNLYQVGVELSYNFTKEVITEENVRLLEENIDKMTLKMPPLNNFLYYSGIEEAVYCHVIRTVTRRCERVFVRFNVNRKTEEYSWSYKYINRLSDFFFTVARFVNHINAVEEEIVTLK